MTLAQARAALADAYLADETTLVNALIKAARLSPEDTREIDIVARELVTKVRAGRRQTGGLDAFLQEYALSSEEGVVLMCLAEALLRVPDRDTADKLIKDKIGSANWKKHLGQSDSVFVNASTWGLMLTGRVIKLDSPAASGLTGAVGRVVARSGEPIIRNALNYAMRMMGEQFVLGRDIEEALDRSKEAMSRGYRYSYDMLGEAAYTKEDADRYFKSYVDAIGRIGKGSGPRQGSIFERPSISVKLSALHPRYEANQGSRVVDELVPRVIELARAARDVDIGFTIDAEEAERLEISLDLFAAVSEAKPLADWEGLGLAVQAYQKRAIPVIAWLAELAAKRRGKIPVRLVKGAYWDTEIKRGQELGLPGYPVFTRKTATDVSYLACARRLLESPEAFYPQFATHNAHSVAAIRVLAKGKEFEFQRLHGMGAPLYDEIVGPPPRGLPCRIYAPVGSHEDLLAYLVRRLLENGANTSFVNRLADDEAPIAEIIADPVDVLANMEPKPHPRIPLPKDLFKPRLNSAGFLVSEPSVTAPLFRDMQAALAKPMRAAPLIAGQAIGGEAQGVRDPSDQRRVVGEVVLARPQDAERAISIGSGAAPAWNARGGEERAKILERAADFFERDKALLMALCIREAGKTVANALSDVREATDFLRYYASEARAKFSEPMELPGPTGERNTIALNGRGVFACIAPWNFPVAIFTGQVAAALAAGNAVLAKPAEETPLAAYAVIKLLHEAGVPGEVLHFLPGDGPAIGKVLTADNRVSGIAFTGSTETARIISRALASRDGPIVPFIAETGGQNAMIVDSTALPEQVVRDVMTSAFDSAGQRCSALRVLFVQEDVAPRIIDLVRGAMDELVVSDPMRLSTDIGPVITAEARKMLEAHVQGIGNVAKPVATVKRLYDTEQGFFFAPRAFEIDSISRLTREVFGPILHIVRYSGGHLDKVCDAINGTGYGLTLSIHSRIEDTIDFIIARAHVGNIYVNRHQIGAVVGSQPFGGEGLSGTGPKAGGPHYLQRFATERVVSTNTTASGGNATLLAQASEG